MADFARLDAELDALGAGLDVDAVLAAIPESDGLEAIDEVLEALGENVQPFEARSALPPPPMNDAVPDAETEVIEAEVIEAEVIEAEVIEAETTEIKDVPDQALHTRGTASALSNFHAGLTPSDVQQLAELEAAEAASEPDVEDGSTPLDASVATEATESSPEDSSGPAGTPSGAPASAQPTPPSAPPEPIFKEEDLAAIRASTPPPPGAEPKEEVEVEVEVEDIEVLEIDELEMDDLDFVEFEDDEMELTGADPSADAEEFEATEPSSESEPAEPKTPKAEPDDGGDGQKKGFFKKIFG